VASSSFDPCTSANKDQLPSKFCFFSDMGMQFSCFNAEGLSKLCLNAVFVPFYRQQQSDETPMVWAILVYIYVLFSPDWHYTNAMPIFLFLYGTCFAIVHSRFRFVLGFQLHYAFLVFLCLPRMYKYYLHCSSPVARHVAQLYIYTLIAGVAFWLLDRSFCEFLQSLPINPQGHAWWHVLMGFNSYYGITFLEFSRASQLDWKPSVVYWWGLPYIDVKKATSRNRAQTNGMKKSD
jgi:dihydroceramidase